MKRILLLLPSLFTLVSYTANAQEISKISFEESEGYTLGILSGQNNWTSYGIDDEAINIVNTNATDGVNSVALLSNMDFEFKGFSHSVDINKNSYRVSLDVLIDADLGSETLFDLIDNLDGNISINFGSDATIWAGAGGFLSPISGLSYKANTWYPLAYEVDFDSQTVDLFFNDTKIASMELESNPTSITDLDFYILDIGSGFSVDNIVFSEIPNANVNDISLQSISISPNPTTDYLNINTAQKIKNSTILDTSGKIILTFQNQNKVDVSSLKSGVYILKVKTDKGSLTKKFIKK